MKFIKGHTKILLLALLIAFASCSFTSKSFENSDKDKLLLQLIGYVLEQGHYSPKEINDSFSNKVFNDFLMAADPYKRYLYASDIKDFEVYKNDIDDQLKNYELTFFNAVHQRLLQRIEESKSIYASILKTPFDYTLNETFSVDYENLEFSKNKKELKERWRMQLKFSTLGSYDDAIEAQNNDESLTASEKKSLEDLEKDARLATKSSLDELYDFIDDRERKDWFSMFINTVVDEFDPHTFYFQPEDKERFDDAMSGKFEGIGARLSKKMDAVNVVEIISGGPAWRADELEVGDKILKVRQGDDIEAISIVGMPLDEAIKLIKGPKGSTVILTLKRVDGSIEDVSIVRDVVEIEETFAKSSLVKKNNNTFGLINLPKFYIDFESYDNRNAASDIRQEIERLKMQGMEGLVLDLRNNGGGSLQTVVDIVGLFIEDGPVVQVKNSGDKKEVLTDKDKAIIWDGPLVVMVNELSASASEILAAAMQDYKRAIVIGSKQTYGKGTVQNVFDLNRMVHNNTNGDMGALKFTTQKFYRINGGSTQLEGVKSDIVVPDRYSYIDLGEKDQENPLPWDNIAPATYTQWPQSFNFETTIANSKARMANNAQLKLIDANAKWVGKMRDRTTFSLNYETYKADLKDNEAKSKEFEALSDFETNLTFTSLPYEVKLMAKDSVLKQKRDRWHNSLSKDVYIDEALNVLSDLKQTTTESSRLATAIKQ